MHNCSNELSYREWKNKFILWTIDEEEQGEGDKGRGTRGEGQGEGDMLMLTLKFSNPNMSRTPMNWVCSEPGLVQELICWTSQVNVLE